MIWTAIEDSSADDIEHNGNTQTEKGLDTKREVISTNTSAISEAALYGGSG